MKKFPIYLVIIGIIFMLLLSTYGSVYACHISNGSSLSITGHEWDRQTRRSSKGPFFSQSTDGTTHATGSTTTSSTNCNAGIAEEYLEKEMEQIEEDSAKGEGEHLDALAGTLGCPTTIFSEFRNTVKNQHTIIFKTSDTHILLEEFVKIIEKTPSLKKVCSIPYS